MRPDDSAAFFRTLEGRVRSGAHRAMERALDVVQERAEDLSSGTDSLEDLALAGHPFRRGGGPARQAGRAGFPPEVINVQDGDFVSAWGQEGPGGTGDTVIGAVDNSDPKAALLAGGTRLMIARPLPEAVVQETAADVERILREELEKALRF